MKFKAIWGIRQQLRVYDPGETVYESPQGEDSEFEVRNTPAGKWKATVLMKQDPVMGNFVRWQLWTPFSRLAESDPTIAYYSRLSFYLYLEDRRQFAYLIVGWYTNEEDL